MYKLQTSDIDNGKYLAALESDSSLYDAIKKGYKDDATKLEYFIFDSEIDEDIYKIMTTALTMGDEFAIPISQRDASLLFFVLNTNKAYYSKELPLKITNRQQANLFYERYEGNYKDIDIQLPEDKQKSARFTKFLARHQCLFPERNLYWEIPISFWKDKKTGESFCYVGSQEWANFAYAQIDDNKVKIPRDIWIKFFEANMIQGKIQGSDSNDIKLMFDETVSRPVWETLKYMGYTIFKTIPVMEGVDYYLDTDMDPGLCAKLLNKGARLYEDDQDASLWNEVQPNVYHFLGRGVEYIPTKPLPDNQIYIYR